uniref:Glycosylphosphatidylinositol anchor attachment 1 protein n=1 Tax=Auxenochlorella protothecoides TaxID=3075 RepID=A0A1D1ZQ10_AUXPR
MAEAHARCRWLRKHLSHVQVGLLACAAAILILFPALLAEPLRLDERALLVGGAASGIREAEVVRALQVQRVVRHGPTRGNLTNCGVPALAAAWEDTINRQPPGLLMVQGVLMHTMVPPKRDWGAEGMALVLEYHDCSSAAAAAGLLAVLTEHFLDADWLAKGLGVALVDGRDVVRARQALEALLAAHSRPPHGPASQLAFPPPTSLHGAAVFSLASVQDSTPAVLGMRLHGRSGRLPNADLAATLSRVAELTPGPARFDRAGIFTWAVLEPTLRSFLATAAGAGDGLHAVFLEAGTDAATLDWPLPEPSDRGAMRQALRSMEGSLRALSNLEERLHHASSMYWPAGGRHVVDGAALLAAGIACLVALALELGHSEDADPNPSSHTVVGLPSLAALSLRHALSVHLACHLGAAGALCLPRLSAERIGEAGVLAVAAAAWVLAAGEAAGAPPGPIPLPKLTAGLCLVFGPALLLLNAPLLILMTCGCLWTLRAPSPLAPLPLALAVPLCLAWDCAPTLVFLSAQLASILVCRCVPVLL